METYKVAYQIRSDDGTWGTNGSTYVERSSFEDALRYIRVWLRMNVVDDCRVTSVQLVG